MVCMFIGINTAAAATTVFPLQARNFILFYNILSSISTVIVNLTGTTFIVPYTNVTINMHRDFLLGRSIIFNYIYVHTYI